MGVIRSFGLKDVYYKPQGFLDADAAAEIITPMDINLMEKKKIKYVMVDFSKVISANMNAIRFFNEICEMLYKKNIETCVVNANSNILHIINNLQSCYFNYFENDEIAKIFCKDDYFVKKPIYLCCIEDDQNKNMLLFHLVRKGYNPKIVNNKNEIEKDAVVIEKSFISKISNRVGAVVKKDIVYFFFNGFLDANLASMFDMEYFRRNLLIGFKVFIFDMNSVKGMNVHAVRFLTKLGVEAAEYGALLSIIGLEKRNIQPQLIKELEDMGFVFFETEEELFKSEVFKDALNSSNMIYKKGKKITKDFVRILPFFVNATINTIELMTGVKATKEPPNIKEVNLDTSRDDLVASSIGFYGDMEGALILIFTEKLSRAISKILLGEEYKTKEELVDMVGEFANIIVGNVSFELHKHDVDINLTLPKVFDKLQDLQNIVINRQGIEVKFYFNEDEFYFYLIR